MCLVTTKTRPSRSPRSSLLRSSQTTSNCPLISPQQPAAKAEFCATKTPRWYKRSHKWLTSSSCQVKKAANKKMSGQPATAARKKAKLKTLNWPNKTLSQPRTRLIKLMSQQNSQSINHQTPNQPRKPKQLKSNHLLATHNTKTKNRNKSHETTIQTDLQLS